MRIWCMGTRVVLKAAMMIQLHHGNMTHHHLDFYKVRCIWYTKRKCSSRNNIGIVSVEKTIAILAFWAKKKSFFEYVCAGEFVSNVVGAYLHRCTHVNVLDHYICTHTFGPEIPTLTNGWLISEITRFIWQSERLHGLFWGMTSQPPRFTYAQGKMERCVDSAPTCLTRPDPNLTQLKWFPTTTWARQAALSETLYRRLLIIGDLLVVLSIIKAAPMQNIWCKCPCEIGFSFDSR